MTGSGTESLLEFIDAFAELGTDFGLDGAPGGRVFGLTLEVEGAGSGRDFALDLREVDRVDGKDDAGRRRVSRGSVDHAGGRILIFVKEGAAEDYFAAQSAAVASAALVRFPAIEYAVGQDFGQNPSAGGAV